MIFLCYPADREIAEKLREGMGEGWEVLVALPIDSGDAMPDGAVSGSSLFAPIITATSNASPSLAGETLLAQLYGCWVVPLLFDESLPPALVHHQFVDFRGAFELGLSDLRALLAEPRGGSSRRYRQAPGAAEPLFAPPEA